MPKVDLSAYAGREQAYVKHCLLEEYLPEWAYKVGTAWDSLVYVDGFAGPGQTRHPDYADSSFGVAIDALRRSCLGLREGHGRNLRVDAGSSRRRRLSPSEADTVLVRKPDSLR